MTEITLTLEQLQTAFDRAEDETAAHFNGQTCSMKNVDGNHECPICYFRMQVKHLLGLPSAMDVNTKALNNEL